MADDVKKPSLKIDKIDTIKKGDEIEKIEKLEIEQEVDRLAELFPNVERKKLMFVYLWEKNATNTSLTCKKVGIHRSTFYLWREDPEFDKLCEDVEEGMIDFAESQLYNNMKNGDTTSIIFYLKTKGKKRGYVEKVEFDDVSDEPTDAESVAKRYDVDSAISRTKKALAALEKVKDRETNGTKVEKPTGKKATITKKPSSGRGEGSSEGKS